MLTRRFWSLRPGQPAPLVALTPRPAAAEVDPDLAAWRGPTRRWFIGALGLVVAKPDILVPETWAGAAKVGCPALCTLANHDVVAIQLERVMPLTTLFYENEGALISKLRRATAGETTVARSMRMPIPMRKGGDWAI